MADGKVVIDTTLNKEDFEKGITSLSKSFEKLNTAINSLAATINSAFGSNMVSRIDAAAKAQDRQATAAKKAKEAVEEQKQAQEELTAAEQKSQFEEDFAAAIEKMRQREAAMHSQVESIHAVEEAEKTLADSSAVSAEKIMQNTGVVSDAMEKMAAVTKESMEQFSLDIPEGAVDIIPASVGENVQELQIATATISGSLDEVKQGMADVGVAATGAFGPNTQKQIDTLTQRLARQQEAAQKAARDVESIRRQYEALVGMEATPASLRRMETELSRVQKEIQKAEKEYANLETSLRKVQEAMEFERLATGVISPQNAVEADRLERELDSVGQKLSEMDDRAQQLQSSIAGIRLSPEQSDEAQRLADKLQNAEEKAARLADEAARTEGQLGEASSAASAFGGEFSAIITVVKKVISVISKIADTVGDVFSKVKSAISKVTSGIGSIFSIFSSGSKISKKDLGGLMDSFGKLVKRIIALGVAALIFNQIRRALRQLVDYLNDAMRVNNQFVSSLASIKGNLLTAFQPIYEAIMPALNTLMAALARITAYIAAFVNLLFGKSVQASQDSASALYDQTKALNATGAAAKKAAGALAAFDEINVLSQETAAGAGAAETVVPDFDFDFSGIESFLDQFDTIPEAAYALGKSIAENIANALANIDWSKVKEQARLIAASIAEFINGFIDTPEFWYELGHTLGEGINTAFEFLEEFADRLKWHELGEMLAYGLNTAIEFWNPEQAGRAIYKNINGILDTIYTTLTKTNWGELGAKLATSLNAIFDGLNWDLLGRTFAAGWNSLVDLIHDFVTTFRWEDFGADIADAINGWFDEIDWGKTAATISTGINGLFASIKTFLKNVKWEEIGKDIGEFLGGIKIEWDLMKDSISTGLKGLITLIGASLRDVDWAEVAKSLSNSLKGALEVAMDVAKEINWQKIGENIATFIANIDWSGVTSAIFRAFGNLRASLDILLFGLIKDALISIGEFGYKHIQDAGGNIIIGLWNGMLDALGNIASWVYNNIIKPFIDGVKEGFGIHSPSTVMAEIGVFLIEGLIEGISSIIQSALDIFDGLWSSIPEMASTAWEGIKAIWSLATEWFNTTIITPISEFFAGLWANISQWASDTWNKIVEVWNKVSEWFNTKIIMPVSEFFDGLWKNISQWASDAWIAIMGVWESVSTWFNENIITPLTEAFRSCANSILGFFETLANGILTAFENVVNGIVDAVNSLLEKLPTKYLKKWGLDISLSHVSLPRVSIPKLATGAVIPPNSEFLALLGDQRSGRNIEAPEGLIRDIVREELSNLELQASPVYLNADPDMAALIRLIFPMLKREEGRVGVSLIGGAAT